MSELPPGTISLEEASRRGLVTHAQAWQLVVPDVPVWPVPTYLFWQLANQYPSIIMPTGIKEACIPKTDAVRVFPEWLIRDARKNASSLIAKRLSHNKLYVVALRRQIIEVETMIASDKLALDAMNKAKKQVPPGF
jgi:hypothetical protein